jgi:lipoyl(octanoyl) transferase
MKLSVYDLKEVDFKFAWEFQKDIASKVKNKSIAGGLILCQHYPVITLGRDTHKNNLLVDREYLSQKGIEIYSTERGGGITYHGPGQLTAYPIIHLAYFDKDIHTYLRALEQLVIDLLASFHVSAVPLPGLTGVWIKGNRPQKIGSIGIAVKQWVSFHGLSLNVKNTDLQNFHLIRPCGMDIEVTSMESVLRTAVDMITVKSRLIEKFQELLGKS